MIRKHTVLLLVLTLMTTLLAPAGMIFACSPSRSTALCPMMAAMQKDQKSACCAKEEEYNAPSLSASCCCHLQPAPEAPVLPKAILAGESLVFVLGTSPLCIPAPDARSIARTIFALEVTAPRGPPCPFAALRAPPLFS